MVDALQTSKLTNDRIEAYAREIGCPRHRPLSRSCVYQPNHQCDCREHVEMNKSLSETAS